MTILVPFPSIWAGKKRLLIEKFEAFTGRSHKGAEL
jgi:hypothetical protein